MSFQPVQKWKPLDLSRTVFFLCGANTHPSDYYIVYTFDGLIKLPFSICFPHLRSPVMTEDDVDRGATYLHRCHTALEFGRFSETRLSLRLSPRLSPRLSLSRFFPFGFSLFLQFELFDARETDLLFVFPPSFFPLFQMDKNRR